MIFILSIWAPSKYFHFLENLISSLSQKVGIAKWHGDMVIFLLVSRKYDAKVKIKMNNMSSDFIIYILYLKMWAH